MPAKVARYLAFSQHANCDEEAVKEFGDDCGAGPGSLLSAT
jgi:hypothetical protein